MPTALTDPTVHRRPGLAPAVRICLLALLLPLGAAADTIVLRNGNRLEGRITEENPRIVRLTLPYGTIDVARKEIKEIVRSNVVSDLLVQGQQLLHHEQFELALVQFEEAVARAPQREQAREALREALLRYGTFLHKVKRYDEAIAILTRARAGGDGDSRAKNALDTIRTLKAAFAPTRLQAEAACTAGSLQDGLALYRKLWDTYPDYRNELEEPLARTQTQLGDTAVQAEDFARAASLYEEALASHPDVFPTLVNRYTYAQARVAQRLLSEHKLPESETVLERALGFCPHSEALHFLMGQTLEALGRLDEALPHYRRVCPDPQTPFDPDKAMDIHGRWAAEERKGGARPETTIDELTHTETTEHFVVTGTDKEQCARVGEALELHFDALAPQFKVAEFTLPCNVYIHSTRARYLEAAKVEEWAPAHTTWKTQFGRVTRHEIITYRDCPQLLSSVLRHELTHLLLAAALGYPRHMPLWANEGTAVMSEPGFKQAYYLRHLGQAALQRRLFAIKELLACREYPPKERVDVFYAQSFSLVQYLVTRGTFERFIAFLKDYRDDSDWDTWKHHYRIAGAPQLELEWEEAALAAQIES